MNNIDFNRNTPNYSLFIVEKYFFAILETISKD